MGVAGTLDTENGLILECPQLPTMHFYPLREKIREKFSLPVVMDNDANALLLGESIWEQEKSTGQPSVLHWAQVWVVLLSLVINFLQG